MAKRIILHPGQEFGRWTVLEHIASSPKALCKCSCDRGIVRPVNVSNLRKGLTRSCGCLRDESIVERSTKHGLQKRGSKKHPLASVWEGMKTRCSNPNQYAYESYGGRGIFVCSGWRNSLESFVMDMGERPKGYTLDRKNNDLGYTCGHCEECIANEYPFNCRWADNHTQSRNKSVNHYIEFNGERLCLRDWARRINVSESTIVRRIEKGWTIEKTLTTPTKPKGGADIFVEFNGQKKSLPDWARELNIKYLTLYNRLITKKWSPEKALSTPVRNR